MQPLDLHVEATPESTIIPHQSSATVKRNNVPCYFYYSGFCSKGDGCSFSHGPDWFTPHTSKYLEDSSSVTRGPLPKDDVIVGKAIESNPKWGKLKLSRTFAKVANQSEPASVNVLKQSLPSQISVAEIEGAPAESYLFPADVALQRSLLPTNKSLEEQVLKEEHWKASPCFHVFADGNNPKNLYYEVGQEKHSLPYVQQEEELNNPSSGYKFEELSEYDPMNPHAEIFCKHGIHDTWTNSESACSLDDAGIVQDEFGWKMPDILLSGERDSLNAGLEVGDCPNVDLRDCLHSCRGIEDCSASCLLRRHYSSHSNVYSRLRLRGNQCSQKLHKRLTALVMKDSAGSPRGYGFSLNGVRKHPSLRRSQVQSFSKHKGKGQLLPTRASRYSFLRGNRSSREAACFAGHKTLDQIKEELMRAGVNSEDSAGCSSINSSVDFPGPKPLSELLKDKNLVSFIADT